MTLHRFAHFGDLHLGPNSRNADRRAAFLQALVEQDTPGLAAWLLPGDLNHARMTIEDRNWLAPLVQRMANRAPVVILYGNHDLPGDLDVFEHLLAVFPIFIVSRPVTFLFRAATGADVTVFALPYPSKVGLVAAGTPHDQIVDQARLALEAIFLDAAAKLYAARTERHITMMLGHVNVAGSIVSSGQPNIGREIEIDAALLRRLGHCYKGLNHIHRAQEVAADAHYAGSVCRLDWGEVEPKSYNVIEYAYDVVTDSWSFRVERRPLDVAPMYHVEGDLTVAGFDWTCNDGGEAEQAGPGFFAGAEVRVRYRFNAAEKSALDEAIVRAPFEGAKRLLLEPIPVHTRAVRAPEVAAAQTLTEKVEAVVRSSGLQWTPSLETKLAVLQGTPDGAAFLSQVQSEMQPREMAEATS